MTDLWPVDRHQEPAGDFHARPIPAPVSRAVWVCEPDGPALVLGSAQRDDVVDADACRKAGVEVVRRRSGGGAVMVVPGEVLWVDVLIGADDPLWERDVGRAFGWIGDAWCAALSDVGVDGVVHDGPLVRTVWSDLVCFAGLGPGEVTAGGAKVVGISQRRTREGVRFQCAALLAWRPRALVDLLALTAEQRDRAATELAGVAAPLPVEAPTLLDALLHRLP